MPGLTMPCLTAANQGSHLGNAIRLLTSIGFDARRVNLILKHPEVETWQEVHYQQPAPGAPLTEDSAVEVHVDPECGYLVPVKKGWKNRLNHDPLGEEDQLTDKEVSRRLWMLGELQLLLANQTNLLAKLLAQVPSFLKSFFCLSPEEYHTFSDDEKYSLLELLPFKRNSYQPAVISMLFTRILGITCTFQSTFTDVLPHILLAMIDAEPTDVAKAYQTKIRILEDLFVPVTCRVVYLYRHPMAIIDHENTRLDAVQLG